MKAKQDARWPDAHLRLKKLYEAKAPAGMSQEEFGQEYGIGSQGMVWQYLNGYTPLNYDAAAKFAKGLRCTIEDISPEIADVLKADILPFVRGKAWKRAASLAIAFLVAQTLSPHEANAASSPIFSKLMGPVYYGKSLMSVFARFFAFVRHLVTISITNPTTSDARISLAT